MKRVTPRAASSILATIQKNGLVKKGFDVRLATVADVQDLLTIGRTCFAYNPPTRRELRYALTKGHMLIPVLIDTKTSDIAGYDIYEFNARTGAMYFSLTCLLPEYRGKGLSHSLLNICHAIARGTGCSSIRTHVAENNKAMIHLLETYGHARGERHKNYYSDGKAALTYRLPLDIP